MNSILFNIKHINWSNIDINTRYTYFHHLNKSYKWRNKISMLNLKFFNRIPSFHILSR